MTTPEFLSHLRSLNVELSVDGEYLRCNAPKAVLTPELSAELRDRKEDILAFLRAANGAAPPLQPASRDGDLSLSFTQQRLWFLDQLEPESSFYNITQSLRLEGALNVEALRKSLSRILDRHEVLRTTIALVDGNPTQVIGASQPCPLTIVDLGEGPDSQRQEAMHRILDSEAKRPFNLSRDLMVRATLLRLGPTEHVLLLVTHHIASDGWSSGILWQELATLYAAFSLGEPNPLPELPIQYADYAVWQRQWLQGEVLETQLSYWKKQLQDVAVLQLPTDRPRPAVQSYRGATESSVFSKALTDPLQALSRKEGVTLFMTLLAAFQTLLHRYSGQEDIAVGTPIAGRTRSETEGLIGFFVNTLVLRSDLSANPTFRELLARVRTVALEAYEHQDLPFEKLVEELHPDRDLSRSPLFQLTFAHQNVPRQIFELPGLTVSPVETHNDTSKFDLSLYTRDETGGLKATLEYNTDLFDAATIKRMLGHFEVLLEGIVANPEQRLSELPILTAAERHQLLVEWNDTKTDYPNDKCIHELFEAQVERTPDAVAVVFEDKELTYRELNCRANQLAHALQKRGVGPEVLVGIFVERSLEMMIGLLGILKAGGAFVPFDPTYPKERLAFMLQDSHASILLTQKPLLEKLPERRCEAVCLDSNLGSHETGENPITRVKTENLAYVMYTSGSTGKPKGVAIPHRAVNRVVVNTDYVNLDASDVVAQVSNYSFDASTFEIWGALLNGAKLVGITTDVILSPQDFACQIKKNKISALFLTTALFNQIAREFPAAFKHVRHLLFGGEAADPRSVSQILKHGCPERLLHVYGPTETTTFATWYLVKSVTDRATTIPIGRPIANTQIYILNRYRQPVPIGVPGELHISGDGLARNYLNRPELTAEKFIPNPFSAELGARLYKTGDLARYLPDGNTEFLGRVDHQVKIRGFRIELGEIEAVLSQHRNVKETVVVAREDVPGEKRLVGYVVPSQEPTPTILELRGFLRQKLPDYMVPSNFVMLETLPLTPNGKIDRRALPSPDGIRDLTSTFTEPRNDIERQLVKIWEEVLTVNRVGTQDNFFDLGGHSLLAAKMFARLEESLQIRLPLATLFQTPTIEALAAAICKRTGLASWRSLVAIQPAGSRTPLFAVPGVGGNVLCFKDLARLLGPDQPFYGLQSRGLSGTEKPLTSIEEIAAAFLVEIRELQPKGPYYLVGGCMGGVVAYEMAQQLHAAGQEVGLLALVETWLPVRTSARQPRHSVRMVAALHVIVSRFRLYIQTLARLRGRQRFEYLLERLKMLTQIVTQRDLFRGDRSELDAEVVTQANLAAFHQYQPRVYPGHVVLFRAEGRKVSSDKDRRLAWSRFAADGLEIHSVPGDDSGLMIMEPNVRHLARQLEACLRGAQAMASTHLR